MVLNAIEVFGGGGGARSPQNILLVIVEMPLEMALEELLVV